MIEGKQKNTVFLFIGFFNVDAKCATERFTDLDKPDMAQFAYGGELILTQWGAFYLFIADFFLLHKI